MRNPIRLLSASPAYIFGRFHSVRVAYSSVKQIGQRLTSTAPPLYISEKYGPDLALLPPAREQQVTSPLSVSQHLERLRRSAVSEGIALDPVACATLLAVGHEHELVGMRSKGVTYADLDNASALRGREAKLAVVGAAAVDAVRALAADGMLLDVATGYLGYSPTRVSIWLFWSVYNEMTLAQREADHQTVRFHYDVHGLNFLYVNFYLTPTDARSGAHVVIEASHRKKRARRLLGTARLDDADALREYGADSLRVIAGPAGSGFFEDASCYHKVLAPLERDRLMLQLRFQ